MHLTVGAESLDPSDDGRAGQATLTRDPHDPLVQGASLIFVALPKEDPKKTSLNGRLHRCSPTPCDHHASAGSDQAADYLKDYIPRRFDHLTVTREGEGLVGEGRKGREAAEDSY